MVANVIGYSLYSMHLVISFKRPKKLRSPDVVQIELQVSPDSRVYIFSSA